MNGDFDDAHDAPESTVTVSRNPDDARDPTAAVPIAVATALGVDPTDLPPLHRTIDPVVIERVMRAPGEDVRLTVPYAGVVLTVGSDGEIRVAPRPDDGRDRRPPS